MNEPTMVVTRDYSGTLLWKGDPWYVHGGKCYMNGGGCVPLSDDCFPGLAAPGRMLVRLVPVEDAT